MAEVPCEWHKNLIVGSGPGFVAYTYSMHCLITVAWSAGSLQTAHYLESAKRDYLVLEATGHVSSFFRKYPRWRQLISLNKRFTGRTELDHNMRHDWNSLLSDPSPSHADARKSYMEFNVTEVPKELLFRSYSKNLWPEAGLLVRVSPISCI